MEYFKDVGSEPVSPNGQCFNTSVVSFAILGVLEFQLPIHHLDFTSLIEDLFLRTNPRFSSIMVMNNKRLKKWKRVDVKLEEHINVPIFPSGMPTESYDEHLDEYISNISTQPFRQDKPLWDVHVFKYPTTKAAGAVIFRVHHSIGDGYSLMGIILSRFTRADDPSLPLTFPSSRRTKAAARHDKKSIVGSVNQAVSSIFRTMSDFAWSVLKSSVIEDDKSPIRSGSGGVEFMPTTISNIMFSLDDMKQIKEKLGVTINDVIMGVIFLGIRSYMQEMSHESTKARSTILMAMNTRTIGIYKSAKDMIKPGTDAAWGNRFSLLEISIPELNDSRVSNPLHFVMESHRILKNKRNSFVSYFTTKLLDLLVKLRGSEEASRYLYTSWKNSSGLISNMIGPVDQMALANLPLNGLYFSVLGAPQSLTITIISYMKNLRVVLRAEKDTINSAKLNLCVEDAFQKISKAAHEFPVQANY